MYGAGCARRVQEKAKLGQDVLINRDGKPYKVSAAEALRIQEEKPEYNAGSD